MCRIGLRLMVLVMLRVLAGTPAMADEPATAPLQPQTVMGSRVASFNHPKLVVNLAWSPDSTRLASASSQDKRIILWDVQHDEKIAELTKQVSSDISKAIAFTPDDKYLVLPSVLANQDKSTAITLADAHTGQIVDNLPEPLVNSQTRTEHPDWLRDVLPDPAGKFMVLWFGNGSDYKIERYGTSPFAEEKLLFASVPDHRLSNPHQTPIFDLVRFSPDGQLVFAENRVPLDLVGGYYYLKFMDGRNGKITHTIDINAPLDIGRTSAVWKDIAFSPDGRYLAIAFANLDSNHLMIWDVATGQLIRTYPTKFRSINAMAWSRDGKLIATSSNQGRLQFWDASSTALIDDVSIHGGCWSIAFSPDGHMVAYGSNQEDIEVRSLNPLQ